MVGSIVTIFVCTECNENECIILSGNKKEDHSFSIACFFNDDIIAHFKPKEGISV